MEEDTERVDRRSEAALVKDWTKGSIIGNLWSLSWPMMISQSLNMIGPTIDMIWVGRLGSAAIAGVGVSGMAVMVVNAIMMGLGMGARAMIARFIGAGDNEGANHVARQAFIVSAGFAVIMVPAGIFLSRPILTLMGVEAEVVAEGVTYMRIMFVGAGFMSFRMMVEGIMQASGDTKTPMRIAVVYRALHLVLAPFLIFGWWIFPRMGVSGAAVTNVFSQGLGLGLGVWFLYTGRTRMKVTFQNFRFDPGVIWRMVRIGVPASIMGMQRGFGNMVLMYFVVPYGTFAVAAHTLCQRIEMFVMMPGMGLGRGASVLVGQNLGADEPGRAEKSGWMAGGLAVAAMVIFSGAILLWAEQIISIFGPEQEVVELAAAFLRIAAVGFILFGLEPVLMQCLSGAGDTLPPMLATVLSFWILQVPLAYFLPRVTDLGVYGIRWARVAGMVAAAVALVAYFKTGRWKRKRV
ncbi:MATE family efflux transporter [Chloroflexota bacterium]